MPSEYTVSSDLETVGVSKRKDGQIDRTRVHSDNGEICSGVDADDRALDLRSPSAPVRNITRTRETGDPDGDTTCAHVTMRPSLATTNPVPASPGAVAYLPARTSNATIFTTAPTERR